MLDRRVPRLLISLGFGLVPCACYSPDSSVVSNTSSESTGPSETGETSSPDPTAAPGSDDGSLDCDQGYACVDDAVPESWNGLSVLVQGVGNSQFPTCRPEAPAIQATGFARVVEPTADCGCGCEPDPSRVGCETVQVVSSGGTECNDGQGATTLPTDSEGCGVIVVGQGVDSWHAPASEVATDACTVISDPVIPEATLVDPQTLCSTDQPALCGEGACQPTFIGPICIWRDGEHECPDTRFSEKYRLMTGLRDTRSCDMCSCSATGRCQGVVQAFSADDCAGASQEFETDTCVASTTFVSGVWVRDAEQTFECVTEGGTLSGDVEPAETITACCLPPL